MTSVPAHGPLGRYSQTEESKREAIENAPSIDGLMPRILGLFEPHRRPLAVTIGLVMTGAALSVIPPLLIQEAFNEGLFPESGVPNITILTTLVIIMVSLWAIIGALSVWQHYLTAQIGNRVMGSLRVRMFEHLQSMHLGFFTKAKTGAIQSRLQNDVGGVATVLKEVIANLLGSTVTVLASLVAMLILSWQLTLVAVILLPLMIFLQKRIGRVRARIAAATQHSLSEMSAMTQEALGVSGILLSKSFGRQRSEVERYDRENQTQIGLQVKLSMSGQAFFALIQLFMSAIPAVIYLIAGILILGGSPLTVGTLVAFTTAQSRLMFPMMNLLQIGLEIQTSRALFARIFEYLDLTPAISSPESPTPLPPAQLGLVEFENVSFRYDERNEEGESAGLTDLNFRVEPGEYVALVGPSGAGKTTITSLIPRFFDVTSGSVKFAGVDVRDCDQDDLIRNIGILSQETFLFNDTIAENIAYAKQGASQKDIEDAARMANIHDTILSFPDGYNTVVGERGYRLSGGEKQRIAIARVLLKDPKVLILDEATSSLDTQSERLVQAALDSASANRTTIAIAHRLSTVVNADRIMVVSGGRIVESGTHRELVSKKGLYAALLTEQQLEVVT
ncbi:MAG: ABC transporter ATP-binding protein [Pontimonas sp.]